MHKAYMLLLNKMQVPQIAHGTLVEESTGREIMEERVKYHVDNVTVRVCVDEGARLELQRAIVRARELQRMVARPPVTTNERLCVCCSLALVCIPEEARLARNRSGRRSDCFPQMMTGGRCM